MKLRALAFIACLFGHCVVAQGQSVFTRYLAQVGDGIVSGGGSFRTLVTIANSGNRVEGTIEFFTQAGSPLRLPIDGEPTPTSSVGFNLGPGDAVMIQTPGTTLPVVAGWARITANGPVAATAIFQYFNPPPGPTPSPMIGTFVRESAVAASKTGKVFTVYLSKSGDASSAIALVNPGSARATVTLRFTHQRGGNPVVFIRFLQGGEQQALFIDQLGAPFTSFDGSVFIVSDVDVTATILRTWQGIPSASLPLE